MLRWILEPSVAVITAVIALVAVSAGVRYAGRELGDRQVPLAGLLRPSANADGGFSGSGWNYWAPARWGAGGRVFLGPWVGMLVVAVVVIVQAVLFADGGTTALGYNTLNMAIVTAFGGWAALLLKGDATYLRELSVLERLRLGGIDRTFC